MATFKIRKTKQALAFERRHEAMRVGAQPFARQLMNASTVVYVTITVKPSLSVVVFQVTTHSQLEMQWRERLKRPSHEDHNQAGRQERIEAAMAVLGIKDKILDPSGHDIVLYPTPPMPLQPRTNLL